MTFAKHVKLLKRSQTKKIQLLTFYLKSMKKLKVILGLILLQSVTLTACSQTISSESDSICFSKEQARTIIRDLELGEICKSLSEHEFEQIQILKSEIKGFKEETAILINKNAETEKKLAWSNKKVKILGMTVKFGLPIGIVGGFILAKTI